MERLPVPPQSTSSDADIASSPLASLTNWYLNAVARLSKPACVPPPGMSRCTHVSPSETPKFSVIVFEYSPEISNSSADGSSPFLNAAIVGMESSSLTQGSSTVSVAGKKRLPTMQWALAGDQRANASNVAPVNRLRINRCMEFLQSVVARCRG